MSFFIIVPELLAATVLVFDADNVVFPEMGAGLNFQHFKRDFARVFEAVLRADGNEGGLILRQQELLAVHGYLPGTGEDHPVLRPVAVHLPGERPARLDGRAVTLTTLRRCAAFAKNFAVTASIKSFLNNYPPSSRPEPNQKAYTSAYRITSSCNITNVQA